MLQSESILFILISNLTPLFSRSLTIQMNTSPVALASSQALWWLNKLTLYFFVKVSSLWFLRWGSNALAKANVSTYVLTGLILKSRQFFLINPISKSALCAIKVQSPTNFKKSGNTSSILGISFTISFVIDVNSVIFSGIGISGLINWLNSSTIWLSTIFTAPISVIFSVAFDNPVVSISKTTNSCKFIES